MLRILFIVLTSFSATLANATTSQSTAKSLNDVTVMLTNKEKTSGGSGVIYSSSSKGSLILTNAHVCKGLQNGGLATTNTGSYLVERYKLSKKHDICFVEVVTNLHRHTDIATNTTFGELIRISGHPFLLPNTVTEGNLSGAYEVRLLASVEKCTEKDYQENTFLCAMLGGMPYIKSFTANTTSAFIAPGNSGSGVFNNSGELVGLAFAGFGRGLSHGLIVPLEYLRAFVYTESKKLQWTEANTSKRLIEDGDSESSNTAYRLSAPTPTNMEKVFFPAIKDSKMEAVIDKLELCRKGVRHCTED